MSTGLKSYCLSLTELYNVAESYFFNFTGGLGPDVAPISTACNDALVAAIDCDLFLTFAMSDSYYGPLNNQTLQDGLCRASCGTALTAYTSKVTTACKSDPQPFPGLPATYWGEQAKAVYDLFCLKDAATGKYCTGTPTKAQTCSDCVVKLFKQISSTPYSNYSPGLAVEWASIQQTCGLSLPTAVPTMKANVTDSYGYAPPNTGAKAPCLSGNTYTVVSGDGCQAIAEKKGVATGTLIALNNILPDCTNLQLGASICLPSTCSIYKVQSGDTCDSIALARNTTFQQLVAWNPTINSYCTNLIAGFNICLSPPGGPVSVSTIPGATVTQTGIYASATVAPPSPIGAGTTRKCGKYYKVLPNDYCQLLALNQTIDLSLFLAINPSIDSGCTNLLVNTFYCVRPTQDWNSTTTSTTVAPPGPTPSGTTPNCYEYYIIQSGDFCSKLQNQFSITFDQLRSWNPDLKSDCSNLQLGAAYCINGALASPTVTSSATQTLATPGAPTASGTTGQCLKV
ncbi:hypothetical protein GQ44DRAFT_735576 [Phaeosphaeriaceae sp. PMI808]|nr:hypothetical protein GQ44DRAFT_735576 [Phaeosphaeriaceae sp. PMI808]